MNGKGVDVEESGTRGVSTVPAGSPYLECPVNSLESWLPREPLECNSEPSSALGGLKKFWDPFFENALSFKKFKKSEAHLINYFSLSVFFYPRFKVTNGYRARSCI